MGAAPISPRDARLTENSYIRFGVFPLNAYRQKKTAPTVTTDYSEHRLPEQNCNEVWDPERNGGWLKHQHSNNSYHRLV